nr:MAG TPA: Ellis van Creveld protein 2 like protein [Caudoviricetes sp.]
MILGFVIGFIAAIVMVLVVGGAAQKYAIKKGWYASAIWVEKEKRWKVRGRFLSVASKLHAGILEEYRSGRKTVKYVE